MEIESILELNETTILWTLSKSRTASRNSVCRIDGIIIIMYKQYINLSTMRMKPYHFYMFNIIIKKYYILVIQ